MGWFKQRSRLLAFISLAFTPSSDAKLCQSIRAKSSPRLSAFHALTTYPEHTLVITSFKRLIAALAFVVPAAALVASPVMAASQTKPKTHHTSSHKSSTHKTSHAKKAAPTAS